VHLSDLEFGHAICKHFDFLREQFGFTFTSTRQDVGISVRYDSPTLYVSVGRYKGETSVTLWVKIETAIIRPYSPRMFLHTEVMTHRLGHFPFFPPIPSDDDAHLALLADQAKEYCRDILRGDLRELETLSQKRAGH
jgi:hypothetical protein